VAGPDGGPGWGSLDPFGSFGFLALSLPAGVGEAPLVGETAAGEPVELLDGLDGLRAPLPAAHVRANPPNTPV
jgi:hypothetical protein